MSLAAAGRPCERGRHDWRRAGGGTLSGMSRYQQFHEFRTRLNERILGEDAGREGRAGGTLVTKRFFALDGKAYEPGAIDSKTKELLGLVASMVLRCDDCIAYHVDQCI